MNNICYFNSLGRQKWAEILNEMRLGSESPNLQDTLTNPALTSAVHGEIAISPQIFTSKLQLAQIVTPLISQVRSTRLPAELWPGLWDWLAAFYFDSICPPSTNGKRKVMAQSRYAFDPDWKRKYRHRISGPVGLFERLGLASKILIHGQPSKLTDWEEQAGSRYLLASNAGIAEALCRLYWDEGRQAPKRGAAPNVLKPGTLRRFSALLLQLDRTYDLPEISSEGVVSLLPKEFNSRLG